MTNMVVYKRHLKSGVYFYVKFWSSKTNKFDSTYSIEKIKKNLNIESKKRTRNRPEAILLAEKALSRGLISLEKKQPLQFSEYILSFWDYENSSYIKMKNIIKLGSIGPDYAQNMAGTFRKNLFPLVKEGLLLTDVTQEMIETWILTIVKNGKISNSTVNSVIKAISVPLNDAFKHGLIKNNPAQKIQYLDTSNTQEKGIPTKEEAKKLITYMKSNSDKKIYLATYLAIVSGMRQGEILALKKDKIKIDFPGEIGLISVAESVAKKAGFKCPKGRKTRLVPIPKELAKALLDLASQNPWNNELVFWSNKVSTAPVASSYIRDGYYSALDAIGINESKRKERKIDFHSLRHFFNSIVRGHISEGDLRSIIGHQSEKMTDHYDHCIEEKILAAGKITSKILSF